MTHQSKKLKHEKLTFLDFEYAVAEIKQIERFIFERKQTILLDHFVPQSIFSFEISFIDILSLAEAFYIFNLVLKMIEKQFSIRLKYISQFDSKLKKALDVLELMKVQFYYQDIYLVDELVYRVLSCTKNDLKIIKKSIPGGVVLKLKEDAFTEIFQNKKFNEPYNDFHIQLERENNFDDLFSVYYYEDFDDDYYEEYLNYHVLHKGNQIEDYIRNLKTSYYKIWFNINTNELKLDRYKDILSKKCHNIQCSIYEEQNFDALKHSIGFETVYFNHSVSLKVRTEKIINNIKIDSKEWTIDPSSIPNLLHHIYQCIHSDLKLK